MTFSIVARSADGTSWGVAVASKFLAVGSAVPAAAAGVGAIATQSFANTAYKPQGLAALAQGLSAAATLERLLADDADREHRQVGIVDADGGSATFTGSGCYGWAGGTARDGYAIQGNILTGPEVVAAMEQAWGSSDEAAPLDVRLLAALAAGDAAGGDSRGRQSAAVYVVRRGAGYGGFDDVAADLRVDDHPRPVEELLRLRDLHELYLTASTEAERVPVTPDLRAELDARAADLGRADFAAWVGAENYEMRVADDLTWIDVRVLAIIRAAALTE
ncbi:DUF1028 domain-containing protein [Pseudolysinimonas sp.]|jgi:uncharacterized Ntn-hydrolase superfamily protein|uniref:DUF1028 domain-containing protein n=1 Tax=Pseudolysinimonas sp. TaxID=2680009 RepID=UPI00378431AA